MSCFLTRLTLGLNVLFYYTSATDPHIRTVIILFKDIPGTSEAFFYHTILLQEL